MKKIFLAVFVLILAAVAFLYVDEFRQDKLLEGSIVYIVPVYGQSLALGEEAQPVTDFAHYGDSTRHHVKTQYMDEKFGYFSLTLMKQRIKRILHSKNRQFETSVYGLGKAFVDAKLGDNVYLCTFPAGQGETGIGYLGSDSPAYEKLMTELRMAYDKAASMGCRVEVPAICWMQGENDLVWETGKDYASLLRQFRADFERDVKKITRQSRSVECILYQTNSLSLSRDSFNANVYDCKQMRVPEAQRQLIATDEHFHASGPVYPYNVMREYVHIDGEGQYRIGYLEGLTLCRLLKGDSFKGLQPDNIGRNADTLIVSFNVPCKPLMFDTVTVEKTSNYGFSVIDTTNTDILREVLLRNDKIYLVCDNSKSTITNAVVRYGCNGEHWKSGRKSGPRGNLRDSQGQHVKCFVNGGTFDVANWCYFFEKGV